MTDLFKHFSTWSYVALNWLLGGDFLPLLISGAFGAFFGAIGAQWAINRDGAGRQLLSQIRAANSAVALSLAIAQSFARVKAQLLVPMKREHSLKRVEYERVRHQGHGVFNYRADYQTVPTIFFPIDRLQTIAFESVDLVGRPLQLVIVLAQTIAGFSESTAERNALVKDYQSRAAETEVEKIARFFGLPDAAGNVDARYPTILNALYTQSDDGIHFAFLLARDLSERSKALGASYQRRFGRKAPPPPTFDTAELEADGLLPDPASYRDWETKFVTLAEGESRRRFFFFSSKGS